MSNHSLKFRRAAARSKIGNHPRSFAAMADHIDATLADSLSSAQIAAIIDRMWDVAQQSKAIRSREVIEEGGVYDARKEAFRSLAA